MNKVPQDAKRIPADLLQSGQITKTAGHVYAWTEVQGTATAITQTEEGMGKGTTQYRVDFECPRCGEAHYIHSDSAHAPPHLIPDPSGKVDANGFPLMAESGFTGHPVRCHCDATLVFRVLW